MKGDEGVCKKEMREGRKGERKQIQGEKRGYKKKRTEDKEQGIEGG